MGKFNAPGVSSFYFFRLFFSQELIEFTVKVCHYQLKKMVPEVQELDKQWENINFWNSNMKSYTFCKMDVNENALVGT